MGRGRGAGEGGRGGGSQVRFTNFLETMLNRVMFFIAFKVPESRKIK